MYSLFSCEAGYADCVGFLLSIRPVVNSLIQSAASEDFVLGVRRNHPSDRNHPVPIFVFEVKDRLKCDTPPNRRPSESAKQQVPRKFRKLRLAEIGVRNIRLQVAAGMML